MCTRVSRWFSRYCGCLRQIVPVKIKKKVAFNSKNIFHSAPNLSSLFISSRARIHHSYSYDSFLNELPHHELSEPASLPLPLPLDDNSGELTRSITYNVGTEPP